MNEPTHKGDLEYGTILPDGTDWRLRKFDDEYETKYRIFKNEKLFAQFDDRNDADDVMVAMTCSTPAPKFDSTDLVLLAHDEWKRREKRKHNHPESPWVTGFMNGFCTDKKWARAYLDELRVEP